MLGATCSPFASILRGTQRCVCGSLVDWSAVCASGFGSASASPSLEGGRWLDGSWPGMCLHDELAVLMNTLAPLFQDWQGGWKASPGAGG